MSATISLSFPPEPYLVLRHYGSNTNEDSFTFTVTDGAHDEFFVFPNLETPTSKPQNVKLTIDPRDDNTPKIMVNTGQ